MSKEVEATVVTGTGDGGFNRPAYKSRKIWGFILMVIAILALVTVVSYLHTPEAIAINALYMIGFGGMFTVGGQALVDAIFRSKWGSTLPVGESKTVETKSTVVSVAPVAPPKEGTG